MSLSIDLNMGTGPVRVKLQENREGSLKIGDKSYTFKVKGKGSEKIAEQLPHLALQVKTLNEFKAKLGAEASKLISEVATAKKITPEHALTKTIDAFLQDLVEKIHFSGAVLIKKDGQTVLKSGYGNATQQTPNTPQTVFQLGSITKHFTAAAIKNLLAGKLDTKINDVLPPEYQSKKWDNITVNQLLCHGSGIINNNNKAFLLAAKECWDQGRTFEPTVEQLISFFQDEELKPGSGYSNNGYYLLGAIVEHRSGKSYGDYIRQDLLPQKMHSTGYYHDSQHANMASATGMHLDPTGLHLVPHVGTVAAEAYAAGALYSSVEDLAIWLEELFSGNIVENVEEMLIPRTPNPEGNPFGYGFEIGDIAGRRAISHGGTIDGFKNQICYFPDSKDTIILLSNNFDIPERQIRDSLAAILNGDKGIAFQGPEHRGRYQGDYNNLENNAPHQILFKGGHYLITRPGQKSADPLVLRDNGRYLDLRWGNEWEFKEDQVKVYSPKGEELGTLYKKPNQ